MPKVESEKKLLRGLVDKVRNQGIAHYLGGFSDFMGVFVNPDDLDIEQYEKMLDTDETVAFGIDYIKLAVIARLGEYQHEDKQITEFIKNQFERMIPDMNSIVGEVLNALWAGFSINEFCIEVETFNGAIKWQTYDVQSIHPGNIEFNLFKKGKYKNHIEKVMQKTGIGLGEPLDVNKIIIYTYNPRFMNPYGKSLLKRAYNAWFIKNHVLPSWSKGLDQYGNPIMIGKVQNPFGNTKNADGDTVTRADFMMETLETLQGNTKLVLEINDMIEMLSAPAGIGTAFEKAIVHFNKMIFRALLMPSLVATEGKVGSYGLGKQQFDIFIFALDKIRQDIEDVLIEQWIKRIIIWNFGEQNKYGSFEHKEFKLEDAQVLSGIYTQMTTQGYVTPDSIEDLNQVRKNIGLPEVTNADFQKKQVEKTVWKKNNVKMKKPRTESLASLLKQDLTISIKKNYLILEI